MSRVFLHLRMSNGGVKLPPTNIWSSVAPTNKFQQLYPGMLRPRGLRGLEAKLFGLGLVVSGLGLGFGLIASGLGLIKVGLVATKICRLRGLVNIPGVYWLLT